MSVADADRRRPLLRAALGFVCCRGVRAAGVAVRSRRAFDARGEPEGIRRWPEKDAVWLRSPEHPALRTLHGWLSTWTGIGLVAAGMARQGYDLSLTRYAKLGWRATFYVAGREHSPTGATGSAFERAPFRAVHVAAWETLART